MMEGKSSGEGIHSLESDDDMMSAMARELVERGRVGESADAVWADLKRERAQHMPHDADGLADGAGRGGRSIVASSAAGAGYSIVVCAASRRVQSDETTEAF